MFKCLFNIKGVTNFYMTIDSNNFYFYVEELKKNQFNKDLFLRYIKKIINIFDFMIIEKDDSNDDKENLNFDECINTLLKLRLINWKLKSFLNLYCIKIICNKYRCDNNSNDLEEELLNYITHYNIYSKADKKKFINILKNGENNNYNNNDNNNLTCNENFRKELIRCIIIYNQTKKVSKRKLYIISSPIKYDEEKIKCIKKKFEIENKNENEFNNFMKRYNYDPIFISKNILLRGDFI